MGKTTIDITDRFARFSALLAKEPYLSGGEIRLHCIGGGVCRCDAEYKGEMFSTAPIVPPKDYKGDRTGDLPVAFRAMVGHITETGFSGAATLSVRVFLGKVYRIKVGFNQDWKGE